MRIVYMGTPSFAVPPLEALIAAEGIEVIAVCTQPDRSKGRGNKMLMSPVKELALRHAIPVLQFEKLRRKDGVEALRALAPDLFVTAAFGQILSPRLLDIPARGTVNLHASLLPRYRGPAPIHWCLIQGETETGVTTMMTDAGIDTGDMLLSSKIAILPDETAGELTERLSRVGAQLLVQTLRRLEAGDCPRMPQQEELATRQPMLEKEHGRMDWMQSAQTLAHLVRGVDPWPGAWTEMGDEVLKIWRVRVGEIDVGQAQPGQILCANDKRGLWVATGDGVLEIVEMQAPAAKRMRATDYLRGHPIAEGTRLGKAEP
ncbi:MAG: methionyl-tRNA formyltransferase [Clostridia bacterium]